MSTVGYYLTDGCVTLDDAYCPDHYVAAVFNDGAVLDVVPITHDDEADTPTHCATCVALIPHRLTPDGYDYVREHVEAARGRPEILAEWAAEYLTGDCACARNCGRPECVA